MVNDRIREQYRTVQVVPLTAFDSTGKINLDAMRAQTERLFHSGVRVFIPCAGSSEFHTLEADEIVSAIEMTRQVVGDEARVICPIGQQPAFAKRLGKQAFDAGADAALVMPLGFPYLSDTGARDYYETILESFEGVAIIYRKAVVPSNALILEIADHPKLMGVKYSLPDVTEFQRVVQEDAGRLDWYCGHAERYAPFFMLAGAPGYTSGAANICPRTTLAMHAALTEGDYEAAMRYLATLRPIEDYRAREENSYNVSFLKSAIRHVGLEFGDPRPPFRRLTELEHEEIGAIVKPILVAEEAV